MYSYRIFRIFAMPKPQREIMTYKKIQLTDDEILEGLRSYDGRITNEYFYGYCRMAYCIFDRRYDLRWKPGMDFYSLAHEYYLYLDKHSWKPLTDRNPSMTLRTWMTNGFRFLVLDKLKEVEKENKHTTVLEGAYSRSLHFDVADSNYKEEVWQLVNEICLNCLGRDSKDAIILRMMLLDGFMGKEAAVELHMTPSAISQRFRRLMDKVVKPYFAQYYEEPLQLHGVYADSLEAGGDYGATPSSSFSARRMFNMESTSNYKRKRYMEKQTGRRTAPERITRLGKGEIFVFGSNLAGMHGGGAAYQAFRNFGAVMGLGVGLQGQSYAIPTMQGGVETIQPYVDQFITFAREHPELTFLVTAIGCGIAGFSPEEIAPLFCGAINVENIHLPASFWRVLEDF